MVLAVALPWYVAICCRLPGFAQYFLWQQNFVRFLAPFDHLKPIWFYGPVLMAGLLPGSLLVIGFIRFLISGRAEVSSRRPPELGYFVLMGGWCLFFFSMSGCKLPTYIMPAFPMLALAIAYYIVVSELHRTAWTRTILASSLLFVCLGHNVALPWYANYRAPLARIAELKDICDDPNTPVVCFPRNCDSIAFYVERDDFTVFRSKQSHLLVHYMQQRPRTVLLLTHRHSLDALRHALTPDLHVVEERHLGLAKISGFSELLMQSITSLMGETSLGLCDVAVIERRP